MIKTIDMIDHVTAKFVELKEFAKYIKTTHKLVPEWIFKKLMT
jgi:hypothetical protein